MNAIGLAFTIRKLPFTILFVCNWLSSLMVYIYIRQTAVHYAQWKEAFDSHLAARQAGGATAEALILHNVDNPHEIIMILGWCDLRQARMFVRSVSWQVAIREMGVVGVVEVWFLERVG